MNEVKKCPKCGEGMELGRDLSTPSLHAIGSLRFRKTDDELGDKIIPFYCKSCGYMELYKEMKKGSR